MGTLDDIDADRPAGIYRELAEWLRLLATSDDRLTRLAAADWFEDRGEADMAASLRASPPEPQALASYARRLASRAMLAPQEERQVQWCTNKFLEEVNRTRQAVQTEHVIPAPYPFPYTFVVPHICDYQSAHLLPMVVGDDGPVSPYEPLPRHDVAMTSHDWWRWIELSPSGIAVRISVSAAFGRCEQCGASVATEYTRPNVTYRLSHRAEEYIRRLIPTPDAHA